ncbi:MAG: 50S ribosomal protein L29 [Clostridia bacterium]|nr:50S ribosomal protein L29 [Clostridia bacterium]
MKKSKRVNYKEMSLEELNKKLENFKTELFNLRFQVVVNQVENPARTKIVKKEIARILTQVNSFKKS